MSEDNDSTHWFSLIYKDVLLRDVFGKIVPGGLLLFKIIVSATDVHSADYETWVWLLAIGPAWVFGFAVQSIGEVIGIIRYIPEDERPRLLGFFERLLRDRSSAAERDAFQKHFREVLLLTDNERKRAFVAQRQFERLAVIKEACGIGGTSLGLCLLFAGAAEAIRGYTERAAFAPLRALLAVAIAICALALLRMHWRHIDRQQWFLEVARDLAKEKIPAGG